MNSKKYEKIIESMLSDKKAGKNKNDATAYPDKLE